MTAKKLFARMTIFLVVASAGILVGFSLIKAVVSLSFIPQVFTAVAIGLVTVLVLIAGAWVAERLIPY